MTSFDVLERLLTIPEKEYHEAAARGEYLSSHLLANFRRCPDFYHRKLTGKVAEKESRAYAVGSAAHKLILEGNIAFDTAYTVANGPVNPKTGQPYGKQSKAYAEWEATQEKPIISFEEKEWLEKLRFAVQSNPEAEKLLAQGRAEGVVRATIDYMPCQIRIDWFSPEFGIVDLKTAADLDWFDSDLKRYGYILQLAFYRMVLREATGVDAPVSIIAVEKDEPYRAGVWFINQDVLDQAERINRSAMGRLFNCLQTGNWPTGFETPRIVTSIY